MHAELILMQTPSGAALRELRDQLAYLRRTLAEREDALAQLRSQLKAFESRYFQRVGVLYARLDDLEARISEREVDLYDSDAARERAVKARLRAEESRAAAHAEALVQPDVDPPASLKTLFRDVARRIHPDYAQDDAEAEYFTVLMARANSAYRRGDAEFLQRLLDDQREVHASLQGDEGSMERERIARQSHHVRRDLLLIEEEHSLLVRSDIAHLFEEARSAETEHRDLLEELASGLREQIADAEYRLQFVDRQVSAHGR